MPPCPHAINERRRQGDTRGDKSENLAASAAVKPKEESLYESLLRYHEEEHRDKTNPIAFKTASHDDEKDRRLSAKPRSAFQWSHSDSVDKTSLSVSPPLSNLFVNCQGESRPFPTWEQEASFTAPRLFSNLPPPLHQMSVDGSIESSIPHGLHGQHSHPAVILSGPYPPANCVECTVHDNSEHPDSSHHRTSSFFKSAFASSGVHHSFIMAEDLKLVLKLAREVEYGLAEQARTLELDEKLAHELAQKLELEDSLIQSKDVDPSEQVPQESNTGLDSDLEVIFMVAPNARGTMAPLHVDYVLTQQEAMGEWQQVPRPPVRRHRSLSGQREESDRVPFACYTPRSSDEETHAFPNPKGNALLQEENTETKEANMRVSCPSWRKSMKWLAVAHFKRGRSVVETSPP